MYGTAKEKTCLLASTYCFVKSIDRAFTFLSMYHSMALCTDVQITQQMSWLQLEFSYLSYPFLPWLFMYGSKHNDKEVCISIITIPRHKKIQRLLFLSNMYQ
jgi:hypothetical protein